MITKDGSITPRVVNTAPGSPADVVPINVAIFTAKGPGVDSDIPIKSVSKGSDIHPLETTSCSIRGIIA